MLCRQDIGLLSRTFWTSFRLSVIRTMWDTQHAVALLSGVAVRPIERGNRDDIVKYVNLCLLVRSKFGFRDSCLTYSLLLCHTLRREGFNARMMFGTRRKTCEEPGDLPLEGHCWVTVDQEELDIPYQVVCVYPEEGTVS